MQGSTAIAQQFIAALEQRDATPIADLLTDDVVEVLPLAVSGGTEPAATFAGRARVMDVQNTVVNSFATVQFTNAVYP